ncbi:hypothetical protein GCQ56_01180 [Marinifilum sp. N1E240]|uniref:Rieske (2Fe-2S) protein n=1 Tax=Marinifilum sp. N1E240 TaxID=2608082 RepID=UPI00128D9479|nr:hypothetical protein [Marinifilum sp. N1E240]MPQ45606.1 hypothetical protein [Marinifilum sp. N1E240]
MNVNKSNLLYFFLLLTLSSLFCSCSSNSEEDEIIPNTYINATIYLDYYSELGSVGNAIYFETINGSSVGYLGHGVIVVKVNNGFSAFDATCSHDIEDEAHVELDGTFAECPICNSKFNLLDGGYPFEGSVARYPLKEFSTSYSSSSNTLRIYN